MSYIYIYPMSPVRYARSNAPEVHVIGPRCQAFLDASVAPPSGACSDNKCKHECTHKTNILGSLGILVPSTVSTPTPTSNTKRDVIALWKLSVFPVLTHQVFWC